MQDVWNLQNGYIYQSLLGISVLHHTTTYEHEARHMGEL